MLTGSTLPLSSQDCVLNPASSCTHCLAAHFMLAHLLGKLLQENIVCWCYVICWCFSVLSTVSKSYAHGLKCALNRDFKVHLLSRTQPDSAIQCIYQGASDPSSSCLLLRQQKRENDELEPSFVIHKMLCFPDPCQQEGFPRCMSRHNSGVKMLRVLLKIMEAV